MGLITDLVGETNKKCFGTKRMPSAKKYASVSESELTKHIFDAIVDAFDEIDDGSREKCNSCKRKLAEFQLDDTFLCERCLYSNKCSKLIQPFIDDVLERYREKFGESSDESSEDESSDESSD